MLQLTVWMNYPSLHQGDMFRALIASGEVDLQVVYAKSLPEDRLQFGWQDDLKGHPYRFVKRPASMLDAMRIAWSQRKRLHIINGVWAEPSFAAAMVVLACWRCSYAIHSEAPDPYVHRSRAKKTVQTAFGRALLARAMGVLPISRLAENYYQRMGVPKHRMYPFGYYLSRERGHDRGIYLRKDGTVQIVFVGQIVKRKGIDLLLEAVQPLLSEYPYLTLSIIGEGDMLTLLKEKVDVLGGGRQVLFEGVVTPDLIPARLSVADLLVLPSRWDGWGVVVNEAFSAGVPVIASDQCGASDLIQNGQNGYVFRSGSVQELRACLKDFVRKRASWPTLRANAAVTGNSISSEEAAPYLFKCLQHMIGLRPERPVPPWANLTMVQAEH